MSCQLQYSFLFISIFCNGPFYLVLATLCGMWQGLFFFGGRQHAFQMGPKVFLFQFEELVEVETQVLTMGTTDTASPWWEDNMKVHDGHSLVFLPLMQMMLPSGVPTTSLHT